MKKILYKLHETIVGVKWCNRRPFDDFNLNFGFVWQFGNFDSKKRNDRKLNVCVMSNFYVATVSKTGC